MNLIDNRTKHERLYDGLIATFEELKDAEAEVAAAKAKMDDIWKTHLSRCVASENGPGNHPVDSEQVIVQDGAFIYQIDFDVDDFKTPKIKRIEWYAKIYKPNR